MPHDPIARAREIGAAAGPDLARRLVAKANRNPALRRTISDDLKAEILQRGRKYARAGWSKGMGLEWSEALLAGADPIIRAAFSMWDAELA